MKALGWLLLACGLGALVLSSAAANSAGNESHIDRTSVDYLRQQYSFFQSLKPARQHDLRKLDVDLHALEKESKEAYERLQKVIDNYNWWLANLDPADRKRVTDAETSKERLKIIQELKDREWVDTLPVPYRVEYQSANEGDRLRLLKSWRNDQRKRRDDWLRETWLEGRTVEEVKPRIPDAVQNADMRQALETFANNLETQLPSSQRDRLRFYRDQPADEREWLKYLRLLVDLADRHPLLPGPLDGPRSFEALPKAVREAFEKGDPKNFVKKKTLPKELQVEVGRWPQFALAMVDYAKQHNIHLPEPIVPATRADMPAEVRSFLDKLDATLKKADKKDIGERGEHARRDIAKLKDTEGKWPDYPRAIMEIAKQHRMQVTAWMLPNRTETWDIFRLKVPRKN